MKKEVEDQYLIGTVLVWTKRLWHEAAKGEVLTLCLPVYVTRRRWFTLLGFSSMLKRKLAQKGVHRTVAMKQY